jgi:ornithine cyclodeaminase/alanine dehydrogenase-like protein (mu-crystallin family)
MHITAISSVRPEARELEDLIWRVAHVVGVDDREHAFESGDGKSALRSGAITRDKAAELWELLSARRTGRRSASEITLFKSVGTAVQDLAVANAIFQRAKLAGRGRELGDFPSARK